MNARIALALFAALPLFASCGGGDDSKQPLTGAKVFAVYCKTCHKVDGSGGALGPPLLKADENWTAEDLRAYIKSPDSFADRDARLNALKKNYRMPMPASNIGDEPLALLVEYVLAL